jgi:hypothetical protein
LRTILKNRQEKKKRLSYLDLQNLFKNRSKSRGLMESMILDQKSQENARKSSDSKFVTIIFDDYDQGNNSSINAGTPHRLKISINDLPMYIEKMETDKRLASARVIAP